MQYNLNTYNGLPSDHVYCMYRDRHGYLWIGTDKGVVKYNGYTFKLFDAANGLPDPDVWDFFEDSKGRIWLSRISYEFGYILNDKYHKVHTARKKPFLFYPRYIRETENGTIFLSRYKNDLYLCRVANDTLHTRMLRKLKSTGRNFISLSGNVYDYDLGRLSVLKEHREKYRFVTQCMPGQYSESQLIDNYLVVYPVKGVNRLLFINTENCRKQTELLTKGTLYNQYPNQGKNYIVTNSHVYIFDNTLSYFKEKPLSEYFSPKQLLNNKVAYVIEDRLWGSCVATTNDGMFMCFGLQHFRKISNENPFKFRYVGSDTDGAHYWWNNEQQKLAVLDSNYRMRYTKVNDIGAITHLAEYSDDKMLVCGKSATALLNKKTLEISPLYEHPKHYRHYHYSDPYYSSRVNVPEDSVFILQGAIYGIPDKDNTVHAITYGNGYQTFSNQSDTIVHVTYNVERYEKISFSKTLNKFFIYSDKVVTIGKDSILTYIDEAMLNAAGINRVEDIVFDERYGNLFIKDLGKLFLFNIYTGRFRQVFRRYNLEQTQIAVHNNILVIASKNGVSFSEITGRGKLSQPTRYTNTKALAYKNLYDIVPAGKEILLNTDSGLLAVKIPEKFPAGHEPAAKYHVVLIDKQGRRNICNEDTIFFDGTNNSVQFDIVNPTGVGNLKLHSYLSGIDSGLSELKSDELQLAGLVPGRYYKLLLRASDDAWQSPDMHFLLYRVPTFWQTDTGRALIWLLTITGVLLIVFVIIYYTRKIVSESHLKKNYLLSLELKAIHAQINPHFIFNTLNTGLYFISENKNREAYAHISSFSELLRSYIKSSRNKYITLSEEINNLENYILLQQYRFEDKFSFSIEADEEINTDATLIPSLLLQPFVENAINHGLLHKEGKGRLSVKFISGNPEKEIICIIDDDGVGREKAAQINRDNPNKAQSYGNTLIADLVKLINTDDYMEVTINYKDKTFPETGTTVIITIKKVHHGK